MKIGIACGGTGGHIFPGLATAEALKMRGHRVVLWLSGRGIEGGSVAGWTGPVISVRASGFPTGLNPRSILAAIHLLLAVRECRKRMAGDRPDVILAMGGYASVGPVMAARKLGVPVVLHESNAVPGRAVSFLAHYASAVAVAFAAASKRLKHLRVVETGFPLRTDLDQQFETGFLDHDLFTVLVMGGSQGAHRLNVLVPEALKRLRDKGLDLQVVHLAGANDEVETRSFYEKAGIPARVFSFLKEIGKAYNAADLAVARSGAATCAEISVCGVPALLVPLPAARRDHQLANAREIEAAGGADVIIEKEMTVEWLANYVEICYYNPRKLEEMRKALNARAGSGAVERLAELVEQVGAGR